MPKKRCLFCREWFAPYIPRAKIQQICGASKCRRKLKRHAGPSVAAARSPVEERTTRAQAWPVASATCDGYRSDHPEYRAQDAASEEAQACETVRKTGTLTVTSVEEMKKNPP